MGAISRQSTSAVRKTKELGPRAKAKSVEAVAHLANVADTMRALLVNNDHSNAFACNICGGRRFTELGLRVDKQLVVSCCECRMGVLRQIPQDTTIFYSDDYYAGEVTRGREYANYEFTAAHSLTWVALLVRALLARGRVLDVGCANGYLLQRLGPDIEKFGIEVNKTEAARAAACGIKILGNDVLDSRLDEDYRGFFDVVTAMATFEHVTDLRRSVELCLDSLTPSGILIFEVPLMSESNDNTTWFKSSLEHIYYPTVSGIENLFRKTLGAHLVGREVVIEGFASNYVGIATRGARRLPEIKSLFEVLSSNSLEGLSEEDKVLNLAFTALHCFDLTPERILALPALFRRVPDANIFERMMQLWHTDAVALCNIIEANSVEHGPAVDQLNAILSSSTWRGTQGLRMFLSRRPRLARLARHSVKLAYLTATGQLYRKLRALYPASVPAAASDVDSSIAPETSTDDGFAMSAAGSGKTRRTAQGR